MLFKGTDKVKMPSLLGLTLEEAKQTLKDYGFEVGKTTYEESTVYAKNIVMDQEYTEGEKVKKGTKVDIVVSKGEPEVTPEPEEPIEVPSDEPADNPKNEDDDESGSSDSGDDAENDDGDAEQNDEASGNE